MGAKSKQVQLPHYATVLRSLRESRGMTTRELSRASGVAHETVRYLESGRREPSYRVLLSLSDFFGVSPREFFAP